VAVTAHSDSPVFLLTLHRSGGTALARLLNCHPDLCIWGEHGGFINQLAEIDQTMARFGPLQRPLGAAMLADYINGQGARRGFSPWTSPVSRAGFRDWAGRYVRECFALPTLAGRRWGFKEIRYHWPATAALLAGLFPAARFIMLERGIAELCISNMLAGWSVEHLIQMGASKDPAELQCAVEDCVYAIQAIRLNFRMIQSMVPDRALIVTHEQLLADPERTLEAIFALLDLPIDPATQGRMRETFAQRGGATAKLMRHDLLTRDSIEALVPAANAAASAALLHAPPDRGRLLGFGPRGKYSFLLGDHDLRSSGYSSMF
jgi:hypothetical protein